MIDKFIDFNHKNLCSVEEKNCKVKKLTDWTPVFINELLPTEEAKMKRETDSKGYVTSTKNCSMSVPC